MDVRIGEVQAQVETASPQPAQPTEHGGSNKQGLTQKNHEQRLEQRRAARISKRLCAM